ncbi:superoxide dismutase [Candidatus Phytoplasma luffae]|uniref:Superoxide dismutase n=1 Tax=Loofah witches'-broom phytoplasma TaxID=35773 RepID=A0A975FJK1_LOWBP|nr:superoxide dismutase [Candidatus Phytoplasma luffae]QTX03219.1 superoxide dismutase [Candidatus Phytoplasma luffae]
MNLFKLSKLNYKYTDLEPFIDSQTMEIHHTKHHQNYINNLNAALDKYKIVNDDLENILKNISSLPKEIQTTVINNGGGHFNHSFFWKILKLNEPCKQSYQIYNLITNFFGNIENFKDQFSIKAQSLFGSGWTWLIYDFDNNLKIINTPNQNNCLDIGYSLLGLDLWEHAYYLSFQNRRKDYIEAFYNVINWSQVEQNLNQAIIKNSVNNK